MGVHPGDLVCHPKEGEWLLVVNAWSNGRLWAVQLSDGRYVERVWAQNFTRKIDKGKVDWVTMLTPMEQQFDYELDAALHELDKVQKRVNAIKQQREQTNEQEADPTDTAA